MRFWRASPPKLRIDALGKVPTGGWSNPRLKPHIHIQAPPDGIYGFDFVADPPVGPAVEIISPIEVTDIWENSPEGVKGVRIHAAQNSKTALLAGAGQPERQPNRFTLTDSSKGTRIVFFPPGADATGYERVCGGSATRISWPGRPVRVPGR